jgi:hypothetical protein
MAVPMIGCLVSVLAVSVSVDGDQVSAASCYGRVMMLNIVIRPVHSFRTQLNILSPIPASDDAQPLGLTGRAVAMCLWTVLPVRSSRGTFCSVRKDRIA